MPKQPPFEKLVLATHNKGKVREIAELMAPLGVATVSAGDLGLPEPEETETTFAGNARLKALASARGSGLPALSDDSGLAVDALGGDPGIYAARWAELPPPTARFICALCLAFPDGTSHVYEGTVEGEIVWPPRGDKGFGYDPIFRALGDSQTFAEIDPAEKHAKSHRADAFNKFLEDQFSP